MNLSPTTPQLPTLAVHGWAIDDAELRFAEARHVYWLPDKADRLAIQPGDFAKLIFRIAQTSEPLHEEPHYEWMWVEVDLTVDGWWRGTLANEPTKPGQVQPGVIVWFSAEHVVDILKPDGWRASEGEDIVRCHTHGQSHVTYVCEHLAKGAPVGASKLQNNLGQATPVPMLGARHANRSSRSVDPGKPQAIAIPSFPFSAADATIDVASATSTRERSRYWNRRCLTGKWTCRGRVFGAAGYRAVCFLARSARQRPRSALAGHLQTR